LVSKSFLSYNGDDLVGEEEGEGEEEIFVVVVDSNGDGDDGNDESWRRA